MIKKKRNKRKNNNANDNNDNRLSAKRSCRQLLRTQSRSDWKSKTETEIVRPGHRGGGKRYTIRGGGGGVATDYRGATADDRNAIKRIPTEHWNSGVHSSTRLFFFRRLRISPPRRRRQRNPNCRRRLFYE